MTDRDRLIRLERIVFGDGVDEPGILTRLKSIQDALDSMASKLDDHIKATVWPSGAAIKAMVVGGLVVTIIGIAGQAVVYLALAQPRAVTAVR